MGRSPTPFYRFRILSVPESPFRDRVKTVWHAVSNKNHLVSGRPENFSGRPERSQVDLRLTASGGTPHSLSEVSGNK